MRLGALFLLLLSGPAFAQAPVYVDALPTDPPYYRVRYEGSTQPGELVYPASFRVWIPPGAKTLRGVVVHQHGCGEGSCTSGKTGAYDLQWQALAAKHDCALLSTVYEQPDKANCQLWCDPRNGSDQTFLKALTDLAAASKHPELASVPWALWGHSGGAHWCGAMTLLHPERVAAAWLRSGAPPLTTAEGKPPAWTIPDAALLVPILCNLGTKEGVTVRDGRFAGVWKGVQPFFLALRQRGGLAAVAPDPLTSHECGNQRYLAIPWLDACLTARLSPENGAPLRSMPADDAWLAPFSDADPAASVPVPAATFSGDASTAVWLPNERIARDWKEYVTNTQVKDETPPPAPTEVRLSGETLTWKAEADLESGVARFVIERDGKAIATVPEKGTNPFGRPMFQNNSYSDTPTQPLVEMRFVDPHPAADGSHYHVKSVNTVGLSSE